MLKANPTKGKGERNIYCPIDSECSDLAAKQYWPAFHCAKCDLFGVRSGDMPENINRELIDHKPLDSPIKSGNDGRMDMAETKICSKCGDPKDIEEFHRSKTAKDGRKSVCKSCISKYMKDLRQGKKDKTPSKPAPVLAPEVVDSKAVETVSEGVRVDNSDVYDVAAGILITRIERKLVERIVEGLKSE